MSLRRSLISLSIAAKPFTQRVNEEPGYALRL